MTPREIALSICEPWFNGDPCEGCECHKVCTKLVERIEDAIKTDREWLEAKAQSYKNFALALQSERDRSADTGKTSDDPETNFGNMAQVFDSAEADHIPDAGKMVASVREDRTVEATSQESRQVEPVAWRYIPSERLRDVVLTSDPSQARLAADYGCDVQPLYTAPPKREPLNTDLILARWAQECVPSRSTPELVVAFTRAIEQELGIGGEE